jgi:hypothetical protein
MKPRVSNILLAAFVLTSLARIAVGGTPDDSTTEHLFLAVVIDSGPTAGETWQQLKASACQAIDSLHQKDRVEILRARDGEPSLHSDSLIQSTDISVRQNLRQCVRDVHQLFFLSKADVPRAVAAAFDHLGKHAQGYRCGVLVVSTGNLPDDQVRQIRRLAAAYKFRGWSLGFLVQQGANRGLFVAASQGELDVMLLDKANLAQWLEKARSQGPAKVQKPPEPPYPGPPDRPEDIRHKPEPRPTPDRRGQSELTGEPNSGQTDHIPPPVPSPLDVRPVPTPPPPPPPRPEPEPSEVRQLSWLRYLLKNEYARSVAVGCGVLGLIVLVVLVTKFGWRGHDLPDLDERAGAPQKLMCTAADQQYDLGEEDSIDTLVIGKGPTSAVPLVDDDELEDEHVKIFHRRHGYKIKNLAEQPVVVGGTVVKKGQKVDLLLPAPVELTKKSTITLFREPVLPPEHEVPPSGEDHETQNVRSTIE